MRCGVYVGCMCDGVADGVMHFIMWSYVGMV